MAARLALSRSLHALGDARRRSYSSFDVFKKLQDSSAGAPEPDGGARKPSQKVTKLVDEILNLTLIEAADLCNLCQEKLSENANIGTGFIPGRMPFPHPGSFFQGGGFMSVPGAPVAPGLAPPGPANAQDPGAAPPPEAAAAASAPPPKEPEKRADVKRAVKLVGFDKEKKIEIIKAVRTLLNINLRESKELIESYPKVIKKNLTPEEAERVSKLITDAGGQVEVE